MPRFEGRRAIVTGGAQGIGAAIALRLASEGAAVAILDRDADAVGAAAEELTARVPSSGSVTGYACDVTDAARATAVIDDWADRGGLDVLVNNAGITRDNLLFRMTRADWDEVLAVNLTAMFTCTQAAQAHMVRQRRGRIVNLSSRSALGARGQANYAAAKAGVQGFTAALAIELGPFGIAVNAVAPGFIATAMTAATAQRQGRTVAAQHDEVAARTPLGRVGLPEEVAAVVAFLASEDASYVSGQCLYVNGGAR